MRYLAAVISGLLLFLFSSSPLGSVIAIFDGCCWYLGVSLAEEQQRVISVREEESFHIAVDVRLTAAKSIKTRPRVMRYHLLEDFDGIDFSVIREGEVIGTARVPSFEEKPIAPSVTGLKFRDGPVLTAPREPGTYYVSARIPPNGEGRLGRHVGHMEAVISSKPVKLIVHRRARPDLIVRDFRVRSAVKRIGQTAPENVLAPQHNGILSVEVANVGDAPSEFPTRVKFYRVLANRSFVDPDEDHPVGGAGLEIPPLRPGESVHRSVVLDEPGGLGRHRFGAHVEPILGTTTEESIIENNRSRVLPLYVQRSPSPQADLVIVDIITATEPVSPGSRIGVLVDVANRGNATVGRAHLLVNRPGSSDQTEPSEEERRQLEDLEPGTTVRVIAGQIEVPQEPGTYEARACVSTKTFEPDKSNNCQDYSVEVE